jgi:hypothetical protein
MRGITKPTRQENNFEIEPKLFEHPAIVVELLALYFEEYIP